MDSEDQNQLVDNDGDQSTQAATVPTTATAPMTTSASATPESRLGRCQSLFSFLTVEPVILLITFAFGIQSIIGQARELRSWQRWWLEW